MTTEERGAEERTQIPPVDHRCTLYTPGHHVHPTQARTSTRGIPVCVRVQPDGQVDIEGSGMSLVRWNHDPHRLNSALRGSAGKAQWRTHDVLAVPSGPSDSMHLFSLGRNRSASTRCADNTRQHQPEHPDDRKDTT
ncbi:MULTISPECIES: hypothetical protein [unclassified Rhodococcus (in: high G+C Gram-positive bacteria)]|uniref:hypothetical protein n=1 Tax=unclassified Rhodococcus (in: high G+C Gram-positive bacteria) TaxID=192944 RepID=UPI0013873B17|nr:hypothetical protein [Rhodococcus sp. AH-ZY2]NCL77981.1 hypothetical protein [Rhodococcus sp. YH1]NCL78650.1 hypothetical protein [Rhodococcus sp. YH1]WML60863.1 hypothetical protein QNA09_00445 [Rhodococcus sp. AH-ZY2]